MKIKRKASTKAVHARRHKGRSPAKRLPTAPPTALAKIDNRPRVDEFTPDQINLLKRTLAKGATEDEFALYLWVAKKHHLDPFTRQLHCVKRFDTKSNQEVMTIQIGIDGYRFMAARSHSDFGGIDEPEYEFEADNKTLKLARVRVWKKGFEHPTVGIAFWSEYAPELSKPASFMWRKMPRGQLAKCAEALALRKAYPDLADMYTDDEMAQADDNRTPQGRVIVEQVKPILTQEVTPQDETIVMAPWKEGRLSLTGNGVNIIKAALTEEEKGKLGILLNAVDKVVHIPAAQGFSFEDACRKHQIPVIWMDSQTQNANT